MKQIKNIVIAFVVMFMVICGSTAAAFAEGPDSEATLTINTMDVHKKQIEGISYKLSKIEDFGTDTTTEVFKEWTTGTENDSISLPVGAYKLEMTGTPKNFSPESRSTFFEVKDDGTIVYKEYIDNQGNDLDDNTFSLTVQYMDGFIIRNDTNETRTFCFCQPGGKNVISTNDESAVITVYDSEGNVKQELSYKGKEAEKIRNTYLYTVTLEKGDYIEFYDRHVERLCIFTEKSEEETLISDVSGSLESITGEEGSIITRIIELVEKHITSWRGVQVHPLMNDEAGKDISTGSGDWMWGRSNIPNTITLTGNKVTVEKVDEEGKTISESETEFVLWKYTDAETGSDTTVAKKVYLQQETKDGNVVYSWADAEEDEVTKISTQNGLLDVSCKLLEDQVYYLQEMSEPEGYQLEPKVYVICNEEVYEDACGKLGEDVNTAYAGAVNSDTPLDIKVSNAKKINIAVTTAWDDKEDQDGVRPNSVTVELLADGEVSDTIILSERNKWTHTFENLPKYKFGPEYTEGKKSIVYSVQEHKVAEYSYKITGDVENGFTITNSHEPAPAATPATTTTPSPATVSTGVASNVVIWSVVGMIAVIACGLFAVKRKQLNK